MATLRLLNFRTVNFINKPHCTKLLNAYWFSSKTQKHPLPKQEGDSKKKSTQIPKITLISPDESIEVVTFDEAKKISERRDLKLVKIIDMDTKTQRPIFKLMTGKEYLAEDIKQRERRKEKKNDNFIKGEKLLMINSRISEHDIESRLRNIQKWISKKYEVRIVISGESDNMAQCENLYNMMEQKLKNESRFLQKRTKGNELKFQIIPPKDPPTSPGKEKDL